MIIIIIIGQKPTGNGPTLMTQCHWLTVSMPMPMAQCQHRKGPIPQWPNASAPLAQVANAPVAQRQCRWLNAFPRQRVPTKAMVQMPQVQCEWPGLNANGPMTQYPNDSALWPSAIANAK